MDIKEFKERKMGMETSMARALSDIISDFKKDTGYTPSSIYVTLETVSKMGAVEPFRVIAEVET